jgi:hypothetical protein
MKFIQIPGQVGVFLDANITSARNFLTSLRRQRRAIRRWRLRLVTLFPAGVIMARLAIDLRGRGYDGPDGGSRERHRL